MNNIQGLTRGRVTSLVRLSSFISLLFIAAAASLQFAPLERPPSPSDLVSATSRQSSGEGNLFASYSAMLGARDNPFEFGQLNRADVQFQTVEQAPVIQPVVQALEPVPEPLPQPNIDGLNLVGTVPGSRSAFALFRDEQSGLVQTIAVGELVRNSILAQVFDDRVELVLGDQKVELALARISDADGAAGASTPQPTIAQKPVARAPRKSSGKPSLGLSGRMLAPADIKRIGLTGGSGLLITGVRRSDGMIEIDDVILEADGKGFSTTREFVSLIRNKPIGATVQITLIRKTQRLSVTLILN